MRVYFVTACMHTTGVTHAATIEAGSDLRHDMTCKHEVDVICHSWLRDEICRAAQGGVCRWF